MLLLQLIGKAPNSWTEVQRCGKYFLYNFKFGFIKNIFGKKYFIFRKPGFINLKGCEKDVFLSFFDKIRELIRVLKNKSYLCSKLSLRGLIDRYYH